MKFDPTPPTTPPTPQQLTELNDALVTATELEQVYAALARHPRVLATPGSGEVFESCREQLSQDIAVLDEHLENLRVLARSAPRSPEGEGDASAPAARLASFPDVEPAGPTDRCWRPCGARFMSRISCGSSWNSPSPPPEPRAIGSSSCNSR